MKKYLKILAYYVSILTISSLVGTLLTLYVLARVPWMVPTFMVILLVCVISWVDYRRLTGNKERGRR